MINEVRQHPASPARLKRAREEGDVAHSNELATAVQLVAGIGALWFTVAAMGNGLRRATVGLWSNSSIDATPDSILHTSQSLLWLTMQLMLPFLVAVFVIGTLGHLMQTRFLVTRPEFSLSRFGPGHWYRNVFSFSGFGRMTIAVPKVLMAIAAGATTVWFLRDPIFSLGSLPTNLLANKLLTLSATVGMSVAVTLLLCSVFDYIIQWHSFHRRNRMSDQELREELRGQTGDPQIARIRHQRMREITRGRQ